MRIRLLQTILAGTALFLSACSTEDVPGEDWDGRLHLSSNVATLTRATHDLDTKIAEGQTVWLYIDKASDASLLYGKELTTTGDNGFSGADNMTFPANEENINIYAFHINIKPTTTAMTTSAYPTGQLTHQVGNNQKKEGGTYAQSDLLYAKTTLSKTDAKSKNGAIELPFSHCLSKIEVILKKSAEVTAGITKLEILNTKLEAAFTPSKGNDSWLTLTASGSETAIEIDHDVTGADGDKLNEAIIIPQTLSDKTEFIRVTLDGGSTLVYKLGAETKFEKGTKYTYTITAKLTGLTVTSKIDDWGTGTGASGDAVME